jgi:hypothetical protein
MIGGDGMRAFDLQQPLGAATANLGAEGNDYHPFQASPAARR